MQSRRRYKRNWSLCILALNDSVKDCSASSAFIHPLFTRILTHSSQMQSGSELYIFELSESHRTSVNKETSDKTLKCHLGNMNTTTAIKTSPRYHTCNASHLQIDQRVAYLMWCSNALSKARNQTNLPALKLLWVSATFSQKTLQLAKGRKVGHSCRINEWKCRCEARDGTKQTMSG